MIPLLADIKPENILLTAFDDSVASVKLADLGMASALESVDGKFPAEFKGTPNYMAPEMLACKRSAAGLELTPRVDVFSLGMACYEMASGGRKCTWSEIGKQTNNELFAVLTDGRCKSVALACMEREPLMRPTAKDLLELTSHFHDTGPANPRDSAVRGAFFCVYYVAAIGCLDRLRLESHQVYFSVERNRSAPSRRSAQLGGEKATFPAVPKRCRRRDSTNGSHVRSHSFPRVVG